MVRSLFLFIMGIASVYAGFSQDLNVQLDTIDNYNGWGWKALVVDNEYIQLVVLPEIGGRILHYGFEGDTYMAVNNSQINRKYDPTTNQTGPWSSWGYGGYKAWPSPQAEWKPSTWPPPPYLDWGNYTWAVEHASADSVIIYLKSGLESYRTPGLTQSRRIKVYKNTSRVMVDQILANVSCPRNEWAVWDVTQAIVDHDGAKDYQNVSTYFPSAESDIKVLMGSKIPTTEVEENVRKFNYAGNGWKLGTLLKEGWACFVDERDEQTYAKIFDIDPVNADYPDQNSNFMLYVGGTYVEIEVQGPLTNIAQGDSTTYTETWYTAGVKGDILTANHAGAVRERLSYNTTDLSVNGEYGIFNSGSLRLKYFNASGQELDADDPVAVNATDKLTLNEVISLPEETGTIRLMAYDANGLLIGVLDSVLVTSGTAIADKTGELPCRIYPTLMERGTRFNIDILTLPSAVIMVEILSLADGKPAGKYIYTADASDRSVDTSFLEPGLYLITIQQDGMVFREKVVVL